MRGTKWTKQVKAEETKVKTAKVKPEEVLEPAIKLETPELEAEPEKKQTSKELYEMAERLKVKADALKKAEEAEAKKKAEAKKEAEAEKKAKAERVEALKKAEAERAEAMEKLGVEEILEDSSFIVTGGRFYRRKKDGTMLVVLDVREVERL